MKFEIEAPDPPEGYEYTGEYRKAKAGEVILWETSSEAFVAQSETSFRRFILRRKIEIDPDKLQIRLMPGWYAMDRSGEWYRYINKPRLLSKFYGWNGSSDGWVDPTLITGFPDVPWQDSLFYVPEPTE